LFFNQQASVIWEQISVSAVIDRYRVLRQRSRATQHLPAWSRHLEGQAILPLRRSAWAGRVVWRSASVGGEGSRPLHLTHSLCRCWPG